LKRKTYLFKFHVATTLFSEKEGKWKGSYFFIFAADPQPGLVDLVDGGDGKF